jgi:eukaryotic-like serine/threonine-protein kinase
VAIKPDPVWKSAETLLKAHLKKRGISADVTYVGAGGSATLFKVQMPEGLRAIKVYDPRFLAGANAPAEQRRLALQQGLIGHTCTPLVQVYAVREDLETAFVEMEFVEYPQLKAVLKDVPDEKIGTLIAQLVEAIRFLEGMNIVHRDIKPENIHVSEDFNHLKLIDLGVVREISRKEDDEDSPDSTDHGHRRQFIATAQYSSPEYLFRLDEPSPEMWKALSIYQAGAVLYDLIAKEPLFRTEVEMGNKFLVARAVLTKTPHFADADPKRLIAAKALAQRCLTKDPSARLAMVSWDDFLLEGATNALASLAAKITHKKNSAGTAAALSLKQRQDFERKAYRTRLCNLIRNSLIEVCGTKLPIMLIEGTDQIEFELQIAIGNECKVSVTGKFQWQPEPTPKTAELHMSALLLSCQQPCECSPKPMLCTVGTIDSGEEVTARDIANWIADAVSSAIDLLDGVPDQIDVHGMDLGTNLTKGN